MKGGSLRIMGKSIVNKDIQAKILVCAKKLSSLGFGSVEELNKKLLEQYVGIKLEELGDLH